MEKRAIQISHELWKQFMTEGYASGGIKCIEGLPEDAQFVTAFLRESLSEKDGDTWVVRPDPVFIFESDQWPRPARSHTLTLGGTEYPVYDPVFQVAECRTCKWWDRMIDIGNIGKCKLTTGTYRSKAVLLGFYISGQALGVDSDFGCTQYEKRDD